MKDLISRLSQNNIDVTLADDQLKLGIPEGFDATDLIQEVKKYKEDLIALMKRTGFDVGFHAIKPCPERAHYALSSAQKRLWFLQELDKSSLAYNMPKVVWLDRGLDGQRVSQAFGALVARHESLRTRFVEVAGEPRQVISEPASFALECYQCPGREVESLITRFVRPFDLRNGPLVRAALIQVDGGPSRPAGSPELGNQVLVVDLHHIITDRVSNDILVKDLMALYQQQELPPLRLQYKDYAEWQQSAAQQAQLVPHRQFWHGEFAQEPVPLELPTDRGRPLLKSHRGASLDFALGPDQTRALRAIAEAEGATLFMVLLAVYNVLLGKLADQEDIVVGVPTPGRQHADLENTVGVFINSLALRNFPTGSLSFRAFVAALKARTINCFDHQEYPFEELVNDLQVRRDTSRNPVFDVMFVFQGLEGTQPPHPVGAPAASPDPHPGRATTAKLDLTLTAVEEAGQICLYFKYSTDLFKRETIERFTAYFRQIVSRVGQDPGVRIADIELLSDREKQQILYEFNATAVPYQHDKTLAGLFEEQVRKGPHHAALACNGRRLTYLELNERSEDLAVALRERTAGSDIIALYAEPSLELVIGMLAIFKLGKAFLPLDPDQPVDRIENILRDCQCGGLVTQAHLSGNLSFAAERKLIIDPEKKLTGTNRVAASRTPDDIAYVIYTSGSTGKPKGVKIKQRNLVNYASWLSRAVKLTFADKSVLTSSFAFDLGYTSIFPVLISGGELHLVPKALCRAPGELVAYLCTNQITYLKVTPTLLGAIVNADHFGGSPLPHLHHIILGGEPIVTETLAKVHKHYAHIRFINHYGPTETTIGCIAQRIVSLEQFNRQPAIGRPIHNVRVFILDKYQQPVPVGVTGELCIGGDGVGGGYLNNDELTRQKFICLPGLPAETIYRTGDLAKWLPDGRVVFLNRIDQQVKIRGYRVELAEIESHLTGYGQIKESAVVMGEQQGDKYLAAYCVSETPIDAAQVRRHLLSKLPDYMVPSYYVHLKSLPQTPNGKLDRKALPAPVIRAGDDYAAPASALEETLVRLWAEVLGIAPENISTNKSFFELGGHSLAAPVLLSSIRKELGIAIHVTTLFQFQTVAALSAHIAPPALPDNYQPTR